MGLPNTPPFIKERKSQDEVAVPLTVEITERKLQLEIGIREQYKGVASWSEWN
jgi:hypothetical protein